MAAKSNLDKKPDLYAGTTIMLIPKDGGTRLMYRRVDEATLKIADGEISFIHQAELGVDPFQFRRRSVWSNLPFVIETTF